MRNPAGIHRDWFDRTWSFDSPHDLYPEVIERLRGTPARLDAATYRLSRGILTRRLGYEWSIQENVGHLGDLDELFSGRIDDYLTGVQILRHADPSNDATTRANHNDRSIEDVLIQVHRSRLDLVARLEALDLDDYARSAYHQRLDTQMRLIDQCIFQATHDDYHLAIIASLERGQIDEFDARR